MEEDRRHRIWSKAVSEVDITEFHFILFQLLSALGV